MKTYKNLYPKIYNLSNLILAWRKARKGKTKKNYVIKFEKDLIKNLLNLQKELREQTYSPLPLKTFILRDPKTRKISKSAFRDRIVHHALHNVIELIFDRIFIYDSCANRLGKGNLFALEQFYKFIRKISGNGIIIQNEFEDNNFVYGYCFKADIKHYFYEVEHETLIRIIQRKIRDKKVIWLIKQILGNGFTKKGMPLGNLTSQFFANVYLDKFDKFVKHILKAKYYIRYVDDFIILHSNKNQLEAWRQEISNFLREELKLELHPEKSKIIPLSRGIDFVGFRNFYYFRLLRKRNLKKILVKIKQYKKGEISYGKILEIFQGWNAYAKWANSLTLRREVVRKIYAKTHL